MPDIHPSVPRLGRFAATAVGALVLSLSFAGSALASERVTLRLLGSSPIYANAVDVHKAAGGSVRVRPARYHYRITEGASGASPGATSEASGNCIDLSHYIVTGRDYQVDLESAADAPELGSPAYLSAGWLQSRAEDLIAAAADPGLEAGAIQVAIWQLSGQARDLDAPSSDAALNARVAELRALAAGRRVPSELAVTVAGAATCIDAAATVTVTGTPGAVVNLAVPGASGGAAEGQVAPQRVTLNGNGVATAALRADAPGTVTVTATTSAPTLLRATKTAGATTPQDQLLLRPGRLDARAAHNFEDCDLFLFGPGAPGGATPLAPAAPPVPQAPAGTTPAAAAPPVRSLAMSLDSPHLAAPGGVAVYRLRVTNNGTRTVRGLRVAQRLDRGVSPLEARGPRGTATRFRRGAAHWALAPLKSGRSATLVLRVRLARSLAGNVSRTTVALHGTGARSATASATTAVVRRVGKTEQGF